jgi:hypothetical protein
VAESLFENGLCLPSGSNLTDSDRQNLRWLVRYSKQKVALKLPKNYVLGNHKVIKFGRRIFTN